MTWGELPGDRLSVCVAVAMEAANRDVEPELAIALSYTESRFNPNAVSSRGAVGPLQIRPVFHCPGGRLEGCDLIKAGVGAIIRYQTKYGPRLADVLCHWNSGNRCYPRSEAFAYIVMKRRRVLLRAQEK